MIYREATMSEPLTKWLRSQGYDVYTEVPSVNGLRTFDMVGQRENDLIVIEMKCKLGGDVIHQALTGQLSTRQVYCAVLSDPTDRMVERCRSVHLGVLQVRGEAVLRLLDPSGGPEPMGHHTKGLRDRLGLLEQGGTAGLPSRRGVGPAWLVDRLIEDYRKKRPKAMTMATPISALWCLS